MKRAFFVLIFFFVGCIRTPRKILSPEKVQTLFLSLISGKKKQGVDDELLCFIESTLKKQLAANKYHVIEDKEAACYHLLLDFAQHDHKNLFLNTDGLSMGKPFSYEIMITLFKNKMMIADKYPLVIFDFCTYPIDVQLRDWYSEVSLQERGQNLVERIMLLFETWVKNG